MKRAAAAQASDAADALLEWLNTQAPWTAPVYDSAGKAQGADFLRNVVTAFPYKIHKVLTDNGSAFADLPKNREGPTRRFLGPHIFDRVCNENGIEHRLTKLYHPWTNGQAERMNRTVKDATIKTFHYSDIESLKAHVLAFVAAYNFPKHLRVLSDWGYWVPGISCLP